MCERFGSRDGVHTLGLLSAPIEVTRLLKSPIPSRLVALVNQLETQKYVIFLVKGPHSA